LAGLRGDPTPDLTSALLGCPAFFANEYLSFFRTRVEVHLSDENGDKPGPHDLRCQLEARPKGHQPISVTHKADSLEQAIDGAAEKLEHALEHLFGKLRGKPRAAVVPFTGKANDKLLAEEFDENEQAAINS
jgi:ribosome-associated translation inhibitor RaiA